jgi:hypothetical protein
VPRKSQIPPYRLHRGSGQAVVHINGRDLYLGVHDTPESKVKYHEIIRKVLADNAKAEMEQGALLYVDITVAELAAKYLPYSETYYTKQGVATSQTAIIRFATNVLLAKFSHLEARAPRRSGSGCDDPSPRIVRLDPAASAKTSIGPAAFGEYARLFSERRTERWPSD